MRPTENTRKCLLRPLLLTRVLGIAAVLASVVGLVAGGAISPAHAAAGVSDARSGPAGPGGGHDAGDDHGLEDDIIRSGSDESSIARFYTIRWSSARMARLEDHYKARIAELEAMNFESLGIEGRIDWTLARLQARADLAGVALDRRWLGEIEPLIAFAMPVVQLEEARWQLSPVEPREAAQRLTDALESLKAMRKRVEAGQRKDNQEPDAISVTATVARRAAGAVNSLRRALSTWFEFGNGYRPDFGWWLHRPYEDLARAMDDYATYLRETVAGLKGNPDDPLVGDPIGRETLMEQLAAEVIPFTPEELIVVGETEMAWCTDQMKLAAAEMGFGDDWKGALSKVKQESVPPGEQDELVTSLAREAIDYVTSRDLVTVPTLCRELWRLQMLSPEGQRTLPFAAYGDQSMLVAYPTDQMPHADKIMSMRGNNRHFIRIVTPHELIPGHHLQGFMAERFRRYRQRFSTPFYVEGWALYWEMKLWDMNYAKGPEDRIGMLFWRMHRGARIVVSLKFHLGQMSPAEMIDYLVDRVGHERANATAEVRRFIGDDYSPLYQCGYMIGGKQLRALHEEAVTRGGMTEKGFNDAVLKCGAIPIELVRSSILQRPLDRGAVASWRFPTDPPGAVK